jgi:protein-tyrosine-phosphatase
MDVEASTPGRIVRAARHAALSDASRLAVVDALAVSDLAPIEVGHLLGGAPSNLVAHHVKVLREAGIVRQVRSEGDRRRTYLQLIPGSLDGLVHSPGLAAARIVFVCEHNSARSQLAAALWRRASRLPATSAGTHPADRVHPGTLTVARKHRLPMPKPKTHRLEDVLKAADLLVSLCDEAHEELTANGTRNVLHWSVPDPVRVGTDAAFESAFNEIESRVQRTATSSPSPLEVQP